mgnify:FL=1|tara:strand:- start:22254 stop:23030 length:777 start_codon:yes stop_codon:yes gene_type:complete
MTPLETLIVSLISAIIGALITWFMTRLSSRRARFIYSVTHNRVGISTEDEIFGSVKLIHNGKDVKNLWLSNVEINNTSLRDFQNVPIQIAVKSPSVKLLNQTIRINDSYPSNVYLDDKYKALISIDKKTGLTEKQKSLYFSTREFNLPNINRGDKIRIMFLVDAEDTSIPELITTINAPGIICKYRPLVNLPLDLNHTILRAIKFGLLISAPSIILIANYFENATYAVLASWILGLLTGSLGFIISKIWDRIRKFLFD